jgi:hypothetical protein
MASSPSTATLSQKACVNKFSKYESGIRAKRSSLMCDSRWSGLRSTSAQCSRIPWLTPCLQIAYRRSLFRLGLTFITRSRNPFKVQILPLIRCYSWRSVYQCHPCFESCLANGDERLWDFVRQIFSPPCGKLATMSDLVNNGLGHEKSRRYQLQWPEAGVASPLLHKVLSVQNAVGRSAAVAMCVGVLL